MYPTSSYQSCHFSILYKHHATKQVSPPQTPTQPTKNQHHKNKQTSPLNELPQVALTSYHNCHTPLTIPPCRANPTLPAMFFGYPALAPSAKSELIS